MSIITKVDVIYQDYSELNCGLPNHWCAIVHHTGSCFAEHIYADTKEELSHLKVGQEFKGGE
jgi:hypothetical protein